MSASAPKLSRVTQKSTDIRRGRAAMAEASSGRDRKVKAKRFLKHLLTAAIDLFENILPSAIKESQWCEASVRQAFTTAKFLQEAITQIPATYAQLVYDQVSASTTRSNLFSCLQCRGGTLHSFTTIAERLDIAFEINPSLSPEIKEVIHNYFLELFGSVAFERSKFYSALFLRHYKTNYSLITKESSPRQLMELHVKYQLQLARGLERNRVVQSIRKSLIYRSPTFSDTHFLQTSNLIMLGHPDCDFTREIIETLEEELRKGEEPWDQELLDLYFLRSDRLLLASALTNTESKGDPSLTRLLIEIINSYASKACPKVKVADPLLYYVEAQGVKISAMWRIDGSEFDFTRWKNVLQLAARGVQRAGKNAVEEELRQIQTSLDFNYDFWRDILNT